MRNERGQEIELWETRKRQNRRKPWEVRWRIDAVSKSRSFLTKALAENYRNDLFRAAKDGEVFSLATGEPVSWQRCEVSFFDHAVGYVRHVWASSAGNTRRTVADNVMRLVLAALDERAMKRDPAPAPMAMVRSALLTYALRFQFNPRAEHEEDRVQPRVVEDEQAAACLAWVARTSRPLSDFANQDAALGLLERACIKLKGAGVSAAATTRRRRGVLLALLDHAVNRGRLTANPLAGVKVKRARLCDAVNPRSVPDYDQAGRLLRAIKHSPNPTDRFLFA